MKGNILKVISLFLLIGSFTAFWLQQSNFSTEISNLEKQLFATETAAQEKQILEELWEISSDNDISLSLKVIDANNQIVDNLEPAEKPLTATVTLSSEDFVHRIEFTPLDIENVYLLKRE
jgi:hypothetical protein